MGYCNDLTEPLKKAGPRELIREQAVANRLQLINGRHLHQRKPPAPF